MSVDFSHTEYLSKKQVADWKKEKATQNRTKKTKAIDIAKKFNIAVI